MSRTEDQCACHIFFAAFWGELRKTSIGAVLPHPDREIGYSDSISWTAAIGKAGVAYHVGFEAEPERRFRLDLSFDTSNKEENKAMFDGLHQHKRTIERELRGIKLSWEKRNDLRYSRVATYTSGSIKDDATRLDALLIWAVGTMPRFYKVLSKRLSRL